MRGTSSVRNQVEFVLQPLAYKGHPSSIFITLILKVVSFKGKSF